MSGNTNKTSQSWNSTSTAQTNPYAPAQPWINQGIAAAGNAFNSGAGQGVYSGERVPGSLSPQTQAGQTGLNKTAANFAGLGAPVSSKNLSSLASGGGNNPFFQQQLNNVLSNVGSQTNNTAAAQGISSSAQNQQLGTALGQAATGALSDQYNKNIEQQLGANALIDQQNQAYANTNANLAGQQIQAGLLNTGLQQAQDQANMQQFNEQQMAPWKGIGLLGDAMNQLAGGYGTSTGTSTGTSQGRGQQSGGWGQALEGMGAGLLSAL